MNDPVRGRSVWPVAAFAVCVVGSVLLWNYGVAFRGDIFGFYRIGTVLPHSPYATPSPEVLAEGEVGYDGQLFLAVALDPWLAHPQTLAALDNPRYRYRRILFPLLGYLLSFGQRSVVPFALVGINALCWVAMAVVIARRFAVCGKTVWMAGFVLGIPGYWCALLLTTSDILAAFLLSLSLTASMDGRYRMLAVWYGLAALTHETMLVVIGSLIISLVGRRQWKDALIVLSGAIPALIWNGLVLWRIPAAGSTTGLFENFALPGVGVVDKVRAVISGPVTAKWLFDSAAFGLLLGTFGILGFTQRGNRWIASLLPCATAYGGFFILSKMQILSYYIDFLRVYASVTMLLVIAFPWGNRTLAANGLLWAWCLMSIAWVGAYSLQLI